VVSAIVTVFGRPLAHLRNSIRKIDVFPARNLASHCARAIQQSGPIVAGAKRGTHRPQRAARKSVGKVRLYAAAGLDIVLAILNREQKQNTLVGLPVADAPTAE
jgi:hypothetical protein